ncbi:epimerase [Auraticoccus cholistanensis]|uniref:epimerase n=1 Tax=Auraticoccus cholistanensis TaxID=2656650 RepID=UPI0018D22EF8
MSPARAVVAGASGFVGTHLVQDLARRGYDVTRVGRRARPGRPGPDASWDEEAAVARLVDGADLLVNLAGRSVGCRYTDARREEILRSRTETTAALHRAVSAAERPPRLWLNASTGTIYRHAVDRPQTESSGELGSGFSVDVAREWERTFFAGELPATRRVALRMAIVLGDGPAVAMLARAARLGLGGPQLDGWWFGHRRYRGTGSSPTAPAATGHRTRGHQRFSWIHVEDLLAAIRFLDEHPELEGPVNLAVPEAGTNRDLMAALRRAVGAPVGLPAPRWLLEPGMWVLRQESELVLKSRWVAPEKLTAAGFTFRWTDLDAAVADAVSR